MHVVFSFNLFDVRYVPDLIQNLISLEALELTDLVITLVCRALKICLGALVVIIGTWRLYYVQGSVVEGGATIIARKIGELALDTTNWLYIHCLGEKALQRLGKHTSFVFGMHYLLEKQFGVKF